MPAGGNGMDWNDEIVRRLRWLWDEGHSTAEIGRRLGVSKNAVVGKAHRLDLPTRPSPISRGGASGPRPNRARPIVPKLAEIMPMKSCTASAIEPKVTIPSLAIGALPTTPDARQRMLVGNKSCCWPIGDPGTSGFRFCDDKALVGKPYCEEHARTAYRPMRRRDEAA